MKRCVAYIDGGSRGNPGVAGYGVDVQSDDGQPLANLSESLGIRTNNFAEYSALIGALDYAHANGYEGLRIYADSELLVRQINGMYKVKSLDLKPLYNRAQALISKLKSFSIHHVPREQNREADRLANLAMDGASAGRLTESISSPVLKVAAVYRGGCFHPLETLDLPENTRCRLTVGREAGEE